METVTKNALSDALNYVMKDSGEYLDPQTQQIQKERILRVFEEKICVQQMSQVEISEALDLDIGRGMFVSAVSGISYVIEKKIPFSAYCAHHWMPFFGYVDIGYIPNGFVLGLSKLHRIVELVSRGVTTQEFLTERIHNAVWATDVSKMTVVRVVATHSCIGCRGVENLENSTETMKKSWDKSLYQNTVNDFTNYFLTAVRNG